MRISKAKFEVAMSNAMISSKDLSEKIGMTQESISKIKLGKQNPRPATIGKIAKALSVTVEDLVE